MLEKIGADKVVYPEKDMGIRLAHNLVTSNVIDYIELSPKFSIFEVIASPQFVNKSIGELDLRAIYGVNVIAIKKSEDDIIVAPGAKTVIEAGDILVIVGNKKALAKLPD